MVVERGLSPAREHPRLVGQAPTSLSKSLGATCSLEERGPAADRMSPHGSPGLQIRKALPALSKRQEEITK